MNSTNNLSSSSNTANQLNTNIRPGTIDLSYGTLLLSRPDCVLCSSTPTTPVSMPPAPPSTPSLMSPPRTRIVTYTIPESESSISFSIVTTMPTRRIHMTQLKEADEKSE